MSTQPTRTFDDKPAQRESTPLLVGLVGPSGSGKTYSALRLASGIQKVSGGDIYMIDTEARRALHYADQFKFRHMEFKAPFGSLDYLAAILHCASKGAKIIIVDSTSHEHEGPGGVLESHQVEQERLAKQWNSSLDKVNMAAWQKPKSERRKLLNSILQMPINFIFCFRAKEKIKLDRGAKPVPMGWMPIAGEEFVYEMTVNILLYPNGGGIPQWQPEESGEKAMIKLPGQFKEIFKDRQPLSENIGEQLARWAAGSPVQVPQQETSSPVESKPQGAAPIAAPVAAKSESPVCPTHNQAMKLIPGGIGRRTNKPFDAFWACQIKDCTKKIYDDKWQNREPADWSWFQQYLDAMEQEKGRNKELYYIGLGIMGIEHANQLKDQSKCRDLLDSIRNSINAAEEFALKNKPSEPIDEFDAAMESYD